MFVTNRRTYDLPNPRERRDSRVSFNQNYQIFAKCGTLAGNFSAPLFDLSTSGAFVQTDMPLQIGGEITLEFLLPNHGKPMKITGEIVRKTEDGIGVEFKIIFRY
jgi:hypothetical protein